MARESYKQAHCHPCTRLKQDFQTLQTWMISLTFLACFDRVPSTFVAKACHGLCLDYEYRVMRTGPAERSAGNLILQNPHLYFQFFPESLSTS